MLLLRMLVSFLLVALAATLLVVYKFTGAGWASICSVPIVSMGLAIAVGIIREVTKNDA